VHRLALLAATASLLAGCGGGSTTGSEGLIASLKSHGVSATSPQPVQPGMLGIGSTVYRVPGGDLRVFTYTTVAKARAAAARVAPDGYTVATESGINQVIDWAAPPHWFRDGREVAVYVGTSKDVVDALGAVAGPQIAGA
jgi:hypothetical protein